MSKPVFLGRRIRPIRVRMGLSQASLAQRLGISASYLNLVEHDRRPVTSTLLLELARVLDVDLRTLAAGSDAELLSSVTEILSEPLFDDHPLTPKDVSAFVDDHPDVARALVRLHQAYANGRTSLDSLGERLLDYQHDTGNIDRTRLSSEQVSDFIQRHDNYFAALETEAERLLAGEHLAGDVSHDDLFTRLARHLHRAHGVTVRILTVSAMGGAMRRYHPERRELLLSETLRRGSRNFQLALQIGLLDCSATLDRLSADPKFTSDESRALCRVALASYFAGAVIMPYDAFQRAAETVRYDVELLGHRFRVGWEQACHRLTTLRRPGSDGVPFYMLRVDMAGNISKRFSAAGIQFPRFSGLCSLWNVHAAFLQPGRVRVQV
ncbi:MAG: ImmA/IrrE family metallo-endopeptidase, partial [bacterium]